MVVNKKRWISWNSDWIKFDSKEELKIYEWIRDWTIANKSWVEELRDCMLLDARPPWIEYIEKFKAGNIAVRNRVYTTDFKVRLSNWDEILLEYKSKWTEKDPVYRLRRAVFLFFCKDKYKFAELIWWKLGNYKFRKYY